MSISKFKRLIKQERIDVMQTNVESMNIFGSKIGQKLKQKFDVNDDIFGIFQNQFNESVVDAWVGDMKASAYIFGDTYEGMSPEELTKTMSEEEFSVAATERVINGGSVLTFTHCYLDSAAVAFFRDGKLHKMNLCFKLKFQEEISPEKFCGLNIRSLNISDNIATGWLNTTDGLSIKFSVLKSLLTSDQPEYVFGK
jgi:hypothetical protein